MAESKIETLKELKEKRRVLDQEISNIEKEFAEKKKQRMSALVGKCFKNLVNGNVFRITAPYSFSLMSINYFQVPAVFVDGRDGGAPVRDDCVFTHASDYDDVLKAFLAEGYQEISEKEFEEIAMRETHDYIFSKDKKNDKQP